MTRLATGLRPLLTLVVLAVLFTVNVFLLMQNAKTTAIMRRQTAVLTQAHDTLGTQRQILEAQGHTIRQLEALCTAQRPWQPIHMETHPDAPYPR